MLHSNSAHNLFKVRSNTTCIYFQLILHMDPYTSRTFSGKRLPGSQETFLWHLILAPRNYILEKGNQLDLFFRVFPKIKLIFAWSSRRTIIGAILGPIHQGHRVYLQAGALHAWVVASDKVALVS